MPNNDGTLKDILQGFNSMQARLGLTPGSAGGQGIQPMATPAIKHPGELSQEMSMRLMQSTQATSQSIQQTQQMQPPNAVGFLPQGGMGGGTRAGGDFAKQYQQNMGQIESNYQEPFQAQQMARQSGQPGFMTLPSPTFMTAPSMGVFRPGFQPPPPISMARTPPMMQTPFTPQLPRPMFQTQMQQQQAQGQMESNEMFAGSMAAIPTAGRIATGIGGAAGGAALGRRFGGGAGAAIGGIAGGLAGFGPVGGLAEQGLEAGMQPAVERRGFGLQMQAMSRNFVTSGSDLAEGGRGLSMKSGIKTANKMQRAVKDEETGGFNMQDMMGITSMAGDMGMMDMAQNSEQIVSQAKNIAKGLSAFMKLANEPDVRRAMGQMSQMRAMGMTVPETTSSMQNAHKFARMAGTSVADLSDTAGLPGAMTFQRAGMSAGLGLNVGMGAGGMARQAISSGAFTPGQAAMAGGMRGIQQQLTEASAATTGINFPMMAMLGRNKEGKLTIDQEKRQRIDSGDVSLTEQAGMAQKNVEQLGGARVITELATRLNELKDELGRQRGPQGTLLATFQAARSMQQELGGAGTVGIGGALRALGLNPQQARTLEVMGQSPQFWKGMTQQMSIQKDEARQLEGARRDRAQEASTLTNQMRRELRPVGQALSGMGRAVSGAYDSASEWFSDQQGANKAAESGGAYVRSRERLSVGSQRTQKQLNRFAGSAAYDRMSERFDAESDRTQSTNRAVYAASLGLAGDAGGDTNEDYSNIGSMLGLTKGIETTTAYQAANTVGGFGGSFGAGMTARIISGSPELTKIFAKQAASVAKGAQKAQQGRDITFAAASRLNREGAKAYAAYSRAEGGEADTKGYATAKQSVIKGILEDLKGKSSWTGDSAQTEDEQKAIAIKKFTASMGAEGAQKYVTEQWDKGLGQSILRSVGKQVSPDERGSWEKSQKGAGFAGFQAGKSLEKRLDQLEDFEETTRELTGFDVGINASDKSYKQFSETVMNSTAQESLALQVAAMEEGGSGAEGVVNKAAAAASYEKLVALVGSEKALDMMDKARTKSKGMSEDTRDMHQRAGRQMMGKSAKEQEKAMITIKKRMMFERTEGQIAAGAADLGEKVEALGQLKGFKTGQLEGAMEQMVGDPSQMEALSKMSPEAAKAVAAYKAAGDDKGAKSKAAQQLRGALQTRGAAKRGESVYGGKGVGGATESGLDKQIGTIEKLAASLTGDAEKDFAKTVPLFAKASAQLSESAKLMKQTAETQSLLAKRLRG